VATTGIHDGGVALSTFPVLEPLRAPLPIAPSTSNGVRPGDGAWGVAFSPDGRLVAASTGSGELALIATATWSVVRRFAAHKPGYVIGVAFSPDGKLIASAGQDGVAIHEVATGRRRALISRGANFSIGVAFSPDGTQLAAGYSDGNFMTIDVASGRAVGAPLAGNAGWAMGVAYSPDGTTLAGGTEAGGVMLWDLATRTRLGDPLTGHTSNVIGVAFAPDGKHLATSSWDGSVIIWDVDPGAWTRHACAVAGRNLTPGEWKQYLGDRPYQTTCAQWPVR